MVRKTDGFSEVVISVGQEAVEVFLGDRVELVLVAHSTTHCQAQPDRGRGLDAVDSVLEPILVGDRTTFAGGDVAAVEPGGDQLREAGIGQ